jgi:hypothetical protein
MAQTRKTLPFMLVCFSVALSSLFLAVSSITPDLFLWGLFNK